MLATPMLLSGVGTLETDVTKPLSAEKKSKMLNGGPQNAWDGDDDDDDGGVVSAVRRSPEHGCCGDVGGVSGTLQWLGSLLRPGAAETGGFCSTGRSAWAMSTRAAG